MTTSKTRGVRAMVLALCHIFFFILFLPLSAKAQTERLLIGLLPEINIFKQKQRFRPLGEYLSAKTGRPVEFTILSRYGNIIESFDTEKMAGAFFGSFTGALAIRRLGVIPLARPVNLDGSSTYQGLLLVRKESGIDSAAAMRGKRMAFVDKATTAGYLFPLAYLKAQGINGLAGFFTESFFTGSHDAAISAVLDGQADIGAAKNTIFEQEAATNPRLREELAIIARSLAVPSNGLAVRSDLPADLRDQLQRALLELEADPAGPPVLAQLGARRFMITTRQDYQPVFDLATQVGIDIDELPFANE